jgi:HSP20 family molecular chaperone IbpA
LKEEAKAKKNKQAHRPAKTMAQQPEHVSTPSDILRSATNASLGTVDVIETPDSLIFHVDIPGLSKADVKVRVSDGNLCLSGERLQEATTSEKHYVRAERVFGAFSRCDFITCRMNALLAMPCAGP